MTYRILSLDGGGVWALAQAKALIALYGPAATGHQVLGHFDLAVANSGGSVVLGGLAEDMTLSQVLALFTDEPTCRKLFQPTKHSYWFWRLLLKVAPKYDTAAKLPALRSLLPNVSGQAMSELNIPAATPGQSVRLLITAFDVDRQLAGFFRSQQVDNPGWGSGGAASCSLTEAIHASSTPPVAYFDDVARIADRRLWDGGVAGYNNPVVAGVMEALAAGVAARDIAVLSIGTGTKRLAGPPSDHPPPLVTGRSDADFPKGAIPLISGAILDDPPDVASFVAHGLCGGPPTPPPARPDLNSRVVRVSPMLSPAPDDLGSWTQPGGWPFERFKALYDRELDAIDAVGEIAAFADLWIEGLALNQAVRMDSDRLLAEVGRDRLPEALADWTAL
jgi:hypothetical protein